jgi:sterol desaturase/sphingolipid hydroxylase (fatty acid hydroxylase superfamily)
MLILQMKAIDTFKESYSNFASYVWDLVLLRNEGGFWHNYFWMLVAVSVFFLLLEWIKPWRKDQPKFRKDFWLDAFYMFFNFFLFSIIIYEASATVVVDFFNGLVLKLTSIDLSVSNPMKAWPYWLILLTGFVMRDFIQWWTHRLLHRVNFLWQFHKLHHSIEQMGFAGHLRYHWMETLVYRTIEYIPLALMGINLHDFFLIHIFALAWGHYNHANISVSKNLMGSLLSMLIGVFILTTEVTLSLPITLAVIAGAGVVGWIILGPLMKFLFNSPEMHIWHHAHDMPESHPHGINFGLTLAIWDYIFGTAHIPKSGRDLRLGFPGIAKYPQNFFAQITSGFSSRKSDT